MPSRAARPPNEAPYPTLVGTATSGTPLRPPTTRRQGALHAGDHDQAVGLGEPVADREQPVQAGDADVVDPVDARRRAPGR